MLVPALLFALLVPSRGVELPEIENRSSSGTGLLATTLHVNISRLGGPIEWTRRSFEGAPTGPTLRVRPGDRLHITLVNELGTEGPTRVGEHFTRDMEEVLPTLSQPMHLPKSRGSAPREPATLLNFPTPP
jgi:FtsP/CotA-like multicopper oxidase with cupredoxin domain